MNAIKSLGHGFAVAYHDITTFFKGVAVKGPTVAVAAGKDLATLGPLANVILAGVDPSLVPVARGAEAILGEVFAAISQAPAGEPQAVVVTIGADIVAGVKDFVDLLASHPAVQSVAPVAK